MDTVGVKHTELKFVTLGDFGVGKSSIISCFANQFVDKDFLDVDRVMLGEDSILRTLRYGALPDSYCRGAAGCVIVYDITSKVSYEGAKTWVEFMKRAGVTLAIAGNKVDLEDKRQVTTEDAKFFADQNGLIFMETSAKVGTNIEELFVRIAKTVAAQPVHPECVINLGDLCGAAKRQSPLVHVIE